MTRKDHSEYIKTHGPYSIQCNRIIFNEEEIETIIQYGHWFEGLQNGTLIPLNEAQKQFVEVANFRSQPITKFEKTWFKYLNRKEIEIKSKDTLYKEPKLEEDTFYSRDMAKKLKGKMFAITSENHKK
jgi:uncharacterized protein YifE (UPF0438 family)